MRVSNCATILVALTLIAVEFPTATAQAAIQSPDLAAGDSIVRRRASAPERDAPSLAEARRLALSAEIVGAVDLKRKSCKQLHAYATTKASHRRTPTGRGSAKRGAD